MTRYGEATRKLDPEKLDPEARKPDWAGFVITSRSAKLSSAARLLLHEAHWEAATILIRTILEDTANLGFICRKASDAARRAELFYKSQHLDEHRILKDAKNDGFDMGLPCEEKRKTNDGYEGYRSALAELTGGSESGRPGWNGKSIKSTFIEAFGKPCAEYYIQYAWQCMLVHTNCAGFRNAFHTEWFDKFPEVRDEVEQATPERIAETATVLIHALAWQVLFVDAIVQGKGTQRFPGRKEWNELLDEMGC